MSTDSRLLIATRNKGKLGEYEQLLAGLPFSLTYLSSEGIEDEVDEAGPDFVDNALEKAQEYARLSGLLTLADDSGLEVEALNGEPGVHSARYAGPDATDEERYQLLLERLLDVAPGHRGARFRCVIAVATPEGETFTAEGVCEGEIAFGPQGSGGFGYDPVFYMPPLGRTMAQLSPEEKNRISHRARAARKIRLVLERIAGRDHVPGSD